MEPEKVELLRFEHLVADARQAGLEGASRRLRRALELSREPALPEFAALMEAVLAATDSVSARSC